LLNLLKIIVGAVQRRPVPNTWDNMPQTTFQATRSTMKERSGKLLFK